MQEMSNQKKLSHGAFIKGRKIHFSPEVTQKSGCFTVGGNTALALNTPEVLDNKGVGTSSSGIKHLKIEEHVPSVKEWRVDSSKLITIELKDK